MGSDFNKLNKIFEDGVIFPFHVLNRLDISVVSVEAVTAYQFPFKVRLVTAQAFPVGHEVGGLASVIPTLTYPKTTASIEPVIAVAVGTTSVAAATEVSLITLDGLGTKGITWNGTTTATDITTSQKIWIYLKTAAAVGSYPSTGADGLAAVCLWLAQLNGPA
jgi:hypothetical protein